METHLIRQGEPYSPTRQPIKRTEKTLWISFTGDDRATLRVDSRPPVEPEIELTREDALYLASLIHQRWPLDALGRIEP